MKEIVITQDLSNAWEVWHAEVPDEFPSEATLAEQVAWLQDNYMDIEWTSMKDSGFDYSEIVEVEPR